MRGGSVGPGVHRPGLTLTSTTYKLGNLSETLFSSTSVLGGILQVLGGLRCAPTPNEL